MKYIFAGYTDKGRIKSVNQDSMLLCEKESLDGKKALLAVICDGMGGFAQGEWASREMVRLFSEWYNTELSKFFSIEDAEIFEDMLYESWEKLFQTAHQGIRLYGETHGVRLGTTATVMLLFEGRYYTAHVGDSKIYEISQNSIRQITQDQNMANISLSEEYVAIMGKKKKKSSVLLQGIGVSKNVRAVYDSCELRSDVSYLLCSDGLGNKAKKYEIAERFAPEKMTSVEIIKQHEREFLSLMRERGENDDITVAVIHTLA